LLDWHNGGALDACPCGVQWLGACRGVGSPKSGVELRARAPALGIPREMLPAHFSLAHLFGVTESFVTLVIPRNQALLKDCFIV